MQACLEALFNPKPPIVFWVLVPPAAEKPEAEHAEARRRLRIMRHKLQGECAVCWDAANEALFLPCQHTLCRACAARLRRCPMCRAPIAHRLVLGTF